MTKMTPLNKQSKRARKAFYAARRGSWNGVCPVTKRVESGKRYRRTKGKEELRRGWEGEE